MTHEDAGNYSAKRDGAAPDQRIADLIRKRVSDNRITCAAAHSIAGELDVPPAEVGAAIDLLEIKIEKCQLGLFGHGKQKSILTATDIISPGIGRAIKESLIDGRLTCTDAWKISGEFKVSKTTIAAACEKIGVKISRCQLGAFK